MARLVINPQEMIGYGGPTVTGTFYFYPLVAANGATFRNSGRDVLHIINNDASPQTLTVQGVASKHNFNNAKPIAVEVGAGEEVALGPFKPANFNQTYNGNIHNVLIDVTTDNWLACIVRLPARGRDGYT